VALEAALRIKSIQMLALMLLLLLLILLRGSHLRYLATPWCCCTAAYNIQSTKDVMLVLLLTRANAAPAAAAG
jgi:hypothetical protein